ncbi:MAG TPA: NTP transferase domain-containing protein [Kofleriaceae bacterium]|nr:NTP transferase domain-containing protein [Kofleriaceae bacterium]
MDVLFPMAGQGARFGHKFKPFLTFEDRTFIEAAVAPFREFQSRISRFVFVYLAAQERELAVSERLSEMFSDLAIETVQLATPTRGPAETIGRAAQQLGARGPVLICDCDHTLDVEPLFTAADRATRGEPFDALLPVWPLDGEDVASWSVALVDAGRVLAIGEKRIPEPPPAAPDQAHVPVGASMGVPVATPMGVPVGVPMGVIGCYGFADIATVAARARALSATNFSDVIAAMLAEGGVVRAAPIAHARFFGDPQRLERATGSAGSVEHAPGGAEDARGTRAPRAPGVS